MRGAKVDAPTNSAQHRRSAKEREREKEVYRRRFSNICYVQISFTPTRFIHCDVYSTVDEKNVPRQFPDFVEISD